MLKLSPVLKLSLSMTTIASLGLLASCSQLRELKEMHDATTEMRDTTKEMNQQTKSMGGNTEEMKGSTKNMEQLTKALSIKTDELEKMTAELYRAAKQGTSMALREEILKRIMESRTHIEKLSKSAKYFMAFEYQIWSGVGPDTAESRDKLAASAAREFMRELQRFLPANSPPISPFMVTEMAETQKAFAASIASANPSGAQKALEGAALTERMSTANALAVTMHLLNPIQEDLVEGRKVEKLSMYSMFKNAILANKEIESGVKEPANFPPYVEEVRSYIDIATKLVNARSESLAVMALARVSPLATSAKPEVALDEMGGNKWTFVTDQVNSKAIRDASLFLTGAIEARDFLQQKAGLKIAASFAKVFYTNAQPTDEMKAAIEAAKAGSKLTERQAALVELAGLVEKFLSYE